MAEANSVQDGSPVSTGGHRWTAPCGSTSRKFEDIKSVTYGGKERASETCTCADMQNVEINLSYDSSKLTF